MKKVIRTFSLLIFAFYGTLFAYLAVSIFFNFAPKGVNSSTVTFALSCVLCLLCAVSSAIVSSTD